MHKRSHRALQSVPDAGRLTATLDPNVLHTNEGSILTANRTLWRAPMRQVPVVSSGFAYRYCLLQPLAALGETTPPQRPLLKRPAQLHDMIPGVPSAQAKDFENVALYPEFVRTTIAYDTLPVPLGTAWGGFPEDYQWHALAPRGVVRNQRGREAAVAYRERAAEPSHYVVMSYDELGWLDGSTWGGLQTKAEELMTSSNARAEAGGELVFNLGFYGGLSGLGNATNAAAARQGGAVAAEARTAAGTVTAPFKSGDIIVREFATSQGTLEVAAETVINGQALHLKNIAVYARGSNKIEIGAREVLTVRNQLAAEAEGMGFTELRIKGTRLTGAKPGKAVDVTIKLGGK